MRGSIEVRHFGERRGSIFGDIQNFSLELVGTVTSSDTFFASGIMIETHGLAMTVKGQLVQEIEARSRIQGAGIDFSRRLRLLISKVPDLSDLSNLSELAQIDVEACLSKLRRTAEKLVFHVLKRNNINTVNLSFNDAIRELDRLRIVSKKSIGYLHTVRVIGNLASHASDESLTNADLQLSTFAFLSVVEEIIDKNFV